MVDGFEPRIRELLQPLPTMPATVIAERVGWPVLDPDVVGAGPRAAAGVSAAGPGVADELCGWGDRAVRFLVPADRAAGRVRPGPHGEQLPVLTMVTGYSRWLSAVLIPSRRAEDLFAGWWQLIDGLGAVPRVLVWDGEGAVGRWRGRRRRADRGVPGASAACWGRRC